ncbi:MAG TPA: transcription antitermination factor NusB [Candidatus Kapabacteria bacterium]|nr:transcription antitermination factor NusB [Candidatus Kapabacteria bacterium]
MQKEDKQKNKEEGIFPLSKVSSIKGSRSLVRAKVLQILYAFSLGKDNLDKEFSHIFYRDFNFEEEEVKIEKLLKPNEVYELEADKPIVWDKIQIEFGTDLIRASINNEEFVNEILVKHAQNWSLDRISIIDKIIITIAVSEFVDFPSIPPRVSIDEALNLSKQFSTDKSRDFINGVLDAVFHELNNSGKLNKAGLGLL